MSKKITLPYIFGLLLLCLFALLCVAPLLYMVLLSFTDSNTLYFKFSDIEWNFNNFAYALVNRNFGRAFLNSAIVVIGSCLLVDIVACMAAYGFAKKPVPGKEKLFSLYLATMMIPGQVTLISMFVLVNNLSLTNTYSALILPMVGAFGIFMMRQFMEGLPNEILEAAEIDGCGELRTFVSVVIPMVRPALITLTIFTFTAAWNNFLWPLIVNTRSEMHVLTVAMSTLSSLTNTNYGLVMAGATLTFIVPFALYIFLQKYFVEGIALGGVKG